MDFQTHCAGYLQNIHRTQNNGEATPELSLFPHLQTFLEKLFVAHFDRDTIRLTQEPKGLDQIGRPDFIAIDGLLPIGYIEAEGYGRDLNRLTGHAKEQNQRFIENLDNFILTNFLDFQLWRDGQLRATANIANASANVERLLEQFLNAGPYPNHLAGGTREVPRQTDAGTPNTDRSDTHG